jgi:tRNA threonylcarbamoyladenosine biosynthesis protein TsaB
MAGVTVAVVAICALVLSPYAAMLVLALDTSTRTGSCAIVRDGSVLREAAGDPDRSQAARLPGDLMQLLAHAGVLLAHIEAFAVVTGPGSFTGLRVGIATMQGLAFACDRPLVGVSGLDALAAIAGASRVVTWVDAWRGEVYSAVYEAGVARRLPEVAPPASILDSLEGDAWTFIGDGAATYRDLIDATLAGRGRLHEPAAPLLAGVVGRLASVELASGQRPAPDAVRPLYIRRPDAQLARDGAGRRLL